MKIIIGLGNIGQEYDDTRHNVGFVLVDSWLKKINQLFDSDYSFRENKKMDALVAKINIDGEDVLLVKPTTFMNLSGVAVVKLLNYYRVEIDQLVVIHDDLDLEFGRLNIKFGGGAGGHHGIESIVANLSSKNFIRLRIGIGRIQTDKLMNKIDGAKYVLGKFTKDEDTKLKNVIDQASNALDCILKRDIGYCMNQYNKKIPDKLPLE